MTRKMKDSGIEWIGEIPREWENKYAFQILIQVECINTGLKEKNLLSLSYGKIKRKDINTTDGLLPASFEGYNVIEKDDIVLRLTDLQNDQKSLRVGISRERGIITSAYVTLRCRNTFVLAEYLYYYIYAFDISKGFYGMGGGVRQSLDWNGLKRFEILLPPFSEQRRISRFLDSECAKIDRLIEQTRASIEEYKKLKQAMITEAVTKGVRGKRKMKDSGIPWIGEIPEEWEIKTVFQIFTQVKNVNIGMQERNLLSLSYGTIKRKDINTTEGLLPASFEGYNIIEDGDIVLRLTDLQNDQKSFRVGLAKERGIITSAYITLRNRSNVFVNYLYYFLHAFDVSKGFYGMGAGIRESLNWDGLKSINVLVPTRSEQYDIVFYLDGKTTEIDNLIAQKESLIRECETYKKGLIYEYTTGKKSV